MRRAPESITREELLELKLAFAEKQTAQMQLRLADAAINALAAKLEAKYGKVEVEIQTGALKPIRAASVTPIREDAPDAGKPPVPA